MGKSFGEIDENVEMRSTSAHSRTGISVTKIPFESGQTQVCRTRESEIANYAWVRVLRPTCFGLRTLFKNADFGRFSLFYILHATENRQTIM